MPINPNRLVLLDHLTLLEGGHESFTEGACALEALAWLTDEPHSDYPNTVSRFLRELVMTMNDDWHESERQKLKEVIPLLADTNDDRDQERRLMVLDWQVRWFWSLILELIGETDRARHLRTLPEELKPNLKIIEAANALDKAWEERRSTAPGSWVRIMFQNSGLAQINLALWEESWRDDGGTVTDWLVADRAADCLVKFIPAVVQEEQQPVIQRSVLDLIKKLAQLP